MLPSTTTNTPLAGTKATPSAERPPAEYIYRLADLTAASSSRVGVKAANLAELARSGFPVPDGFVVGTIAFERFLSANSLDSESTQEVVEAAPIPPDLTEAIRAAAIPLGGAPLAVRSSGAAEDLPGASFAGQYETFLGVRGPDAVLNAVRRCWASAFAAHVTTYRLAKVPGGAISMAVLVQRMVPADAAGVAFSANPVNGDRGEVVVSAVRGLGERLVSGQTSPDEWVVRGEEAVARSAPEGAIDAEQARIIAEVARRVEAHFGSPQDVEWARADGRIYLLQARPITTLPAVSRSAKPVPVEVPPGFWERDDSHSPKPLSPMFRSVFLTAQRAAFKRAFDEASLLVEGMDFREIGGWLYQRLIPLGGKDGPTPPSWLMPLLIRLIPQLRRRIKGMVEAVRSDLVGSYVDRWYAEWKPGQVARTAELRAVDPHSLSDDVLVEHVGEVLAFFEHSVGIHALVSTIDIVVAELAFACRDVLGWDDGRALEMISGLSETTSEPARRLAELAQMARERPAVRALFEDIEQIERETINHLAEADGAFATAFAAYQRDFGARPLSFDVAEPTLAEQPALVLGLIRDQLAWAYDPEAEAKALAKTRADVVAEARRMLADASASDRARFERALARAERGYPIREDHEFYLMAAPPALLRYALLEVGDRLAGRGQLAERDDIFLLELREALDALSDGSDRKELVAERKAEQTWTLAHPGPASYGKAPGPPPSFAAFPPEARQSMEAMFWLMERILAPGQSGQAQGESPITIRGIAVSAGRYTGPVRVISSESEFGKLQAGDVLVCPTTTPVWSVLFPSIGALVTDTGGILSHPAIIAREYRVPGVVATGNATKVLRDGQVVTVDGDAGLVGA